MLSKKTGEIWHNPYNVYKHIARLTKKVGAEAIEKSGKLRPVREARITAITALAMYNQTGKPAYIQLCKDDPPDAYIMQKSREVKGQLDISTIEITSYREGANETFLEQLKRTKTPYRYHKYSDRYILVIDQLTRYPIDFSEANTYLNDNNVPFPVWSFRAISLHPDTIGEMTIVNPTIHQLTINFGEAAFRLKELGLPEIVFMKQVLKPEDLREDEPVGIYNEPPWDREIEDF